MRRSRVPSPAPALYGRSYASATLTTSSTHSRPPRSTGRLSVTGAGPPSGTNNGSRTSSSTSCLLRRRPEAGAQTPNPSLKGYRQVTLWRSSSNWKNTVSAATRPVRVTAWRRAVPCRNRRRRRPAAAPTAARRTTPGSAPGGWCRCGWCCQPAPQVDQLSAEPLNVGSQGRHPICVHAAHADFSPPAPSTDVTAEPVLCSAPPQGRCSLRVVRDASSGGDPVEPPAEADERASRPVDIPDPVQQPAPAAQRPGVGQMPDRLLHQRAQPGLATVER